MSPRVAHEVLVLCGLAVAISSCGFWASALVEALSPSGPRGRLQRVAFPATGALSSAMLAEISYAFLQASC